MAFSHVYSDSGLFGIYGVVASDQAQNFATIVANTFLDMRSFTELELKRGKNSLKSSIFMNLESNGIALEDLGRQLLMCGKMASGEEFAKLIDEIQASDLTRVAKKLLESRPTVVQYGEVGKSPLKYEEICGTMKKVREHFGK